jgi:hypothetical protein
VYPLCVKSAFDRSWARPEGDRSGRFLPFQTPLRPSQHACRGLLWPLYSTPSPPGSPSRVTQSDEAIECPAARQKQIRLFRLGHGSSSPVPQQDPRQPRAGAGEASVRRCPGGGREPSLPLLDVVGGRL